MTNCTARAHTSPVSPEVGVEMQLRDAFGVGEGADGEAVLRRGGQEGSQLVTIDVREDEWR